MKCRIMSGKIMRNKMMKGSKSEEGSSGAGQEEANSNEIGRGVLSFDCSYDSAFDDSASLFLPYITLFRMILPLMILPSVWA
jgi:hypothetical protein